MQGQDMLSCSFSAKGRSLHKSKMPYLRAFRDKSLKWLSHLTVCHLITPIQCFKYVQLVLSFVKHWQRFCQPRKNSRRCHYLVLPRWRMWTWGNGLVVSLGSVLHVSHSSKCDIRSSIFFKHWIAEHCKMLPMKEPVLQMRLYGGGLEHLPKDFEVCFCKRAARSSWRI